MFRVSNPKTGTEAGIWLEISGVGTWGTVKFLNFGMLENFAVIYLKFKQRD